MEFTDAELFLLGWAAVATVMYFKAKAEAEVNRKTLMHFIRDEKARAFVLESGEKFKKAHGA